MGQGQHRLRHLRWAVMVVVCTTAVACGGGSARGQEPAADPSGQRAAHPGDTTDGADADRSGGATVEAGPVVASGTTAVAPGGPVLGAAVPPDLDGPEVELTTLQESPYIGAAVYPRPDYEGNPWSQWGQGIVLADGRVLAGIGDHLGVDGNSYLFVYDPAERTLTRFADVASAVSHRPGEWGYGKIHSQMVDPGDGGVYFSTYWGSRRGLTYGGSYQGDVLFRIDQATLALQPVSVPVPGHGTPSLATDGRGLIFGETVDPLVPDDQFPFGGSMVFDVRTGSVTTFPDDPARDVFRNIMVGADGSAWFAGDEGTLLQYDPTTSSLSPADAVLSASLRASTAPDDEGVVYGVTEQPYRFFSFGPDGEVRDLSAPLSYTTSLALLPDGSAFLHVPGAHGDGGSLGAPLIAVDTDTGEQTTLVELADLVSKELGLQLGGTYSVTVDPVRGEAQIGFNAGPAGAEPWGEVVFVVVELP